MVNLTPSPFLEFGDLLGEAKECPLDAMPVGLALRVHNLLILGLGCLPAGWKRWANVKGTDTICVNEGCREQRRAHLYIREWPLSSFPPVAQRSVAGPAGCEGPEAMRFTDLHTIARTGVNFW